MNRVPDGYDPKTAKAPPDCESNLDSADPLLALGGLAAGLLMSPYNQQNTMPNILMIPVVAAVGGGTAGTIHGLIHSNKCHRRTEAYWTHASRRRAAAKSRREENTPPTAR
jgi:hypothetical protein